MESSPAMVAEIILNGSILDMRLRATDTQRSFV
jgi:hypothetical protein